MVFSLTGCYKSIYRKVRYNNLKQVYLSFCWYVLLHNVSSPLNFSDIQKFCAYLKRHKFMGILGPNVAFNSDRHPAHAQKISLN